MLKPTGSYEATRAAAVDEIGRLESLRHPAITYVFDAFEFEDTFYIVTERCDYPLSRLWEVDGLDTTAWLQPVARCILQALQFLHQNRLAHHDIHPGNVFIAFHRSELGQEKDPNSLTFKLGDFGVAVRFSEISLSNQRAQWMLPPEILNEPEFGPVSQVADIYHVGLLLLQLALGRRMTFSNDEIVAGRPRELALGLPSPLNFAIEKALRRHVPYRTQSPMELWRDLRALEA